MADVNLLIDIPREHYWPSETITGEVLWTLPEAPGTIELSLGWWTEGRGTRDAKVVEQQRWETQALAGQEAFSLSLPASPYSFSGSLISLLWALELRTKKGKHSISRNLLIAPYEEPIELPALDDDEGTFKSFSFGRNR